ncbi:hypothetical protein GQ44DRAFT_734315 [Phaeosphaeriaceae sp. PMI808]|nr:hypothetical protein GQ44DRAFT_734315 [Phaeosphaeriaceae sp. PMI808]
MGISQAVKEGHMKVKKSYKNIQNAKSARSKSKLRDQFFCIVGRNIARENVLCRYFELVLADGKALADRNRQELGSIVQRLEKLQSLPVEEAGFDRELQALWTSLSQHFRDEEESDLPRLEEKLTREESKGIGKNFTSIRSAFPYFPSKNTWI